MKSILLSCAVTIAACQQPTAAVMPDLRPAEDAAGEVDLAIANAVDQATPDDLASPDDAAADAAPDDLVTPNDLASAFTLSPSSENFDLVVVAITSAPRSFTVTNNGAGATATLTVSFQGTDAADFSTVDDDCSGKSVAFGSSCTFTVVFTPGALGVRTAMVRVQSSDGASQLATLTGTGAKQATLTITPATDPYSFGLVAGMIPSNEAIFTVKNTGDVVTGTLAITLEGGDAAQFAFTSKPCDGGTLAAAAECEVRVRLTPDSSSGTRATTLKIVGSPGGTLTLGLQGTATTQASLTRTQPATSSIDFGGVVIGISSPTVDVVITNSGGVPTGAPVSVTLSGGGAARFEIVQGCGSLAIAAAATCTIKVRYNPTTTNTSTATLDISASPGGALSLDLSGHGLNPAALVFSGTLGFGNVGRGSSADLVLTLSNSGDVATGAPVGVAIDAGTHSAMFSVVSTDCSAALAPTGQPGNSCSATVRFSPPGGTTNGEKTATLRGTAPSLTATANLTGSAVDPSLLGLAPAGPHDYGIVDSDGSSEVASFTVTNSGGSPSGTLAVSLSDETHFAITSNDCSAALAGGGGFCTIEVTFTPVVDSTGVKTTTLNVVESGAGTLNKSLSGTARAPAKLAWSPASYDWGGIKVARDDAALNQTFTLTNNGELPSTAITISTSGDTAEFLQGASTCTPSGSFTLAAGASCTIVYRFRPVSGGTRSMSLTATASSGAPGGVSATLAGKGQWQLTIAKSGSTGTGGVTSSPGGITCDLANSDCNELYDDNTTVTLTAAPDASSSLTAWTGCTPDGGNPLQCTVVMDSSGAVSGVKTVNADFDLKTFTLILNRVEVGSSEGTVVSKVGGVADGKIDCSGSCASDDGIYTSGTTVTLEATPAAGFAWQGWSGTDCTTGVNSADSTTCTVLVDAAKTVTATFTPFNKVFVTTTSFGIGATNDTQFNSISDADDECAQLASAAGLAGTSWKAWLSASGLPARARFANGVRGWVRTGDELPVISNMTALQNTFQFFHPINRDQSGNEVSTAEMVWTGTTFSGGVDTANCTGFTVTSGTGGIGDPWTGGRHWTDSTTQACTETARIYCFQNDYQAVLNPAIPSSNAKRAFITNSNRTLLSTIADLDGYCQSDADGASLGGTWKALVTPNGNTAASRFSSVSSSVYWYRVDGAKLFNRATLEAGGLPLTSLNVTAAKAYEQAITVWNGATNTNVPGTADNTCGGWNDSSVAGLTQFGNAVYADGDWWAASSGSCSLVNPRYYCLEQ